MLEKKGKFIGLGEARGTMKEDQGVIQSKNDLRMNKLDVSLSGNLFTQQRMAMFCFILFFSQIIMDYPKKKKNPPSNRSQNSFNNPLNQYHIDLLIRLQCNKIKN